jgi:hypothetical protein
MKNLAQIFVLLASAFLFSAADLNAATTWTGASDGVSWNDAANWNSGLPTSTVDAILPDVTSGVLGVGGGTNAAAKSITVDSGSSAFQIVAAGVEILNLSGNFTNSSVNVVDVALDTSFLANSILDGPITFSGIANVDLRSLTIVDSISFSNNVLLQLNSVASYGKMTLSSAASLNLSGASISFSPSSTYTGVSGDIFQLVNISAGSWSGVTGSTLGVGSLPALTGGLTWNTANFSTNGSISVVPEPATWALLAGSLTTVVIFRRRRSKF